MLELPACMKAVEPLARVVYESGWRPPYSSGPTRDELVGIVFTTSGKIAGVASDAR